LEAHEKTRHPTSRIRSAFLEKYPQYFAEPHHAVGISCQRLSPSTELTKIYTLYRIVNYYFFFIFSWYAS
jgi:hypothetical protein